MGERPGVLPLRTRVIAGEASWTRRRGGGGGDGGSVGGGAGGQRYRGLVQLVWLLALGATAMAACGERASPPLEVVVPTQPAMAAGLTAVECAEAEQVCGHAFGRDCPGLDRNSCATHCAGSGLQPDGGTLISEQCGNCLWDYGVVCGTARRAAKGACDLLERCEAERRGVTRRP